MTPFPDPVTATIDLQRQVMEETLDFGRKAEELPDRLREIDHANLGQTPHEVVYEENKLELLHYEPLVEEDERHSIPFLFVYALINRPYILDLQPDKSVIRRFLEHGFDVYLINWNEPSVLDRQLSLHHYVNVYMDNCVNIVRKRSEREAVNLFGYCMGGTMSAMYAALHAEKVRNLVLLATGLQFDGRAGVLEMWADDYDPEAIVETFGNVPAEFLAAGFADMNPINNYMTKYVQLYRKLDNEGFVENFGRMERWLREGVDIAGKTYVQFIGDIYQDNKLYENEFMLNGTHVDIQNINMPVLQVVGEFDNLIPPTASKPFNNVIASDDTEIMEFPSGHVGLAVSDKAHANLWPQVCKWLERRS